MNVQRRGKEHPDYELLGRFFENIKKIKPKREQNVSNHFPLVSILVPAYNEENTIMPTIESLLEADYPNKEIIVIDDGSEDNTFIKAQPYAIKGKITLLKKPRGGKASALDLGLGSSRGDIIISMDSDTVVHRNSCSLQQSPRQTRKPVRLCSTVRGYE